MKREPHRGISMEEVVDDSQVFNPQWNENKNPWLIPKFYDHIYNYKICIHL